MILDIAVGVGWFHRRDEAGDLDFSMYNVDRVDERG
jgi:hypothetical protein